MTETRKEYLDFSEYDRVTSVASDDGIVSETLGEKFIDWIDKNGSPVIGDNPEDYIQVEHIDTPEKMKRFVDED